MELSNAPACVLAPGIIVLTKRTVIARCCEPWFRITLSVELSVLTAFVSF